MGDKDTAKIFWSGRSQAVRLPKAYRFDVDEVTIRREGQAVILEPVEKPSWREGFWEEFDALPSFPDDFELPDRPHVDGQRGYRDEVVEGWVRDRGEP